MHTIIGFDKWLLLQLNGSESPWLDSVMWQLSDTRSWIMVALILLVLVIRRGSWRGTLLFVLFLALAITLADQISSSIFKPLFARLRPTHDPQIGHLVDVVHGYRGGRYGFVSSHAANVFAVAVFVSRIVRSRALGISLGVWAVLVSYSRIYLGVHYPGDILCGALLGTFIGWLCSWIYFVLLSYRPLIEPMRGHTPTGYSFSYVTFFLIALYVTYAIIFLMAIFGID